MIIDVVIDIYEVLQGALETHYPDEDWSELPPVLRYASWIGGDRDGNPNVTSQVTMQTLATLRKTACEIYLEEIRFLSQHLTQDTELSGASRALQDALAHEDNASERYPVEIYRQQMSVIQRRLEGDEYKSSRDLLRDLLLVQGSLNKHRGMRVAMGAVQRLVRKVRLFGLHLVPLEVRENAASHSAALDEMLRHYGIVDNYLELDESAKQKLLNAEIRGRRPLFPSEISVFAKPRRVSFAPGG